MITREIIRNYTARVIVHRILRENTRELRMALEFKGIKANSLRLMANHDTLNRKLAGAVESSDKLISHVGDFKDMSDRMVDDIEFAANTLGNGGGHSGEAGKPKEEPKPSPGQLTPSELKAAVEGANGQQTGVPTRVADLVEHKA